MTPPLVHAPTALEMIKADFEGFLEERIRDGAAFQPGESIQAFWAWFQVGMVGGQAYVLAPELGIMPMKFQEDCSNLLNLILIHRYLCDSFDVDFELCDACQPALVINDFEDCEDRFMNRLDPQEDGSSGWYFGAFDSVLDPDVEDNLKLVSLWELSCIVPVVLDFFLLPVGWQMMIDRDQAVCRDFEIVDPIEDSYYQRKYPISKKRNGGHRL